MENKQKYKFSMLEDIACLNIKFSLCLPLCWSHSYCFPSIGACMWICTYMCIYKFSYIYTGIYTNICKHFCKKCQTFSYLMFFFRFLSQEREFSSIKAFLWNKPCIYNLCKEFFLCLSNEKRYPELELDAFQLSHCMWFCYTTNSYFLLSQ